MCFLQDDVHMCHVKSSFFEKATKTYIPLVLTLCQSKWKIFSNFMAFSKCLNFICRCLNSSFLEGCTSLCFACCSKKTQAVY